MTGATRSMRTASLRHERHFYRAGCHVIFGLDEAGRGPLAGPVAAGAVALPLQRGDLSKTLRGVRDSKDMRPAQRAELDCQIKHIALGWGIGSVSAAEIDRLGIMAATKFAMLAALDQAYAHADLLPDCLFLDYLLIPERRDIPQVSIVKGDKHSLSIACASVIAKVWRDNHMLVLDAQYPQYGFAGNKGYGSEAHRQAIQRHGPCAEHRLSFAPLSDMNPRRENGGGVAAAEIHDKAIGEKETAL